MLLAYGETVREGGVRKTPYEEIYLINIYIGKGVKENDNNKT